MSTRTWLATDYYDLLGVERDASPEGIARAFRNAAKEHHPDRTDDVEARERFKHLSAAYRVLGDPERRARYDAVRAVPVDITRPTRPAPASAPAPVPGPGPVPGATRTPARDSEAGRALSVRALPERRHGRWALIGGTALLVAGLLTGGLVAWLAATGPGGTENGSDPTGRLLTLALVAVKLVGVGIVFAVLGNRRRRHP